MTVMCWLIINTAYIAAHSHHYAMPEEGWNTPKYFSMTCQKLERGGSDFIFHIYIAHTYLDVFQNKNWLAPTFAFYTLLQEFLLIGFLASVKKKLL